MKVLKSKACTRPGNVYNGWWIIDRWVEVTDGTKRGWVTALCPSCSEPSERRQDTLATTKTCTKCYDRSKADKFKNAVFA